MKEEDRKAHTHEDDVFLELCQQYAELARREEAPAVSPVETGDEALKRFGDLEAERRILLWRILSEAERMRVPAGARIEGPKDVAASLGDSPPREAKEARRGAFIEQLGSLLRVPFRGADKRRSG